MESQLLNQKGADAFHAQDVNAAFKHWLESLDSAPSPGAVHNLQVLGSLAGNLELLERYKLVSQALYTPLPTTKPVLAIYTGYSPTFTGKSVELKQVWGSELAAVRLAEALSTTYDVTVFCSCLNEETQHNDVKYLHLSYYGAFSKSNQVDVLIVSRFMHFFLEHECRAKKVVLWLHDRIPHYMWKGTALPETGRPLFVNMLKSIDKVVCVSKWQAEEALPGFVGSKVPQTCVIGNAIHKPYFTAQQPKVKGRFIFCTDPTRGLDALMTMFQAIVNKVPHATLHVYWSRDKLPQTPPHPSIAFFDKLPQQELAIRLQEAEIMAYPNTGHETYCMAALEAQAAGCVVVCRDFSGVAETVSDRGILVPGAAINEDWIQRATEACVNLLSDESRIAHLSEKSRAWALEQTWDTRGNQWTNMLHS